MKRKEGMGFGVKWACALALASMAAIQARADGWSESPLDAKSQYIEWLITKDNGTTFVKFRNIPRYYSFNNKPSFLASLLAAKTSDMPVRIYSTTAASGEATTGLPPSDEGSVSHQLGGVFLLQ